uniref:C-C motif chemokine n=1 Tax=Electrophorus electricus TaxID=8005 RepID=A0AAY5ET89_ELEEL
MVPKALKSDLQHLHEIPLKSLLQDYSISLGNHALDCCLTVNPKPIPKAIVSSYREQLKDDGCSINAIVFQTKRGIHLCAPPQDDWAKELKVFLDVRSKRCLKNKKKHCQRMKPKSA